MEEFLQVCRNSLDHLDDYSKVKVVMGNESCDLDSAVSALVYAYFIFQQSRDSYCDSSASAVVLPLLNIPKLDWPLKTDVVFYFAENHVPINLLIFRDQIDLKILHASKKLELVLVDFHVLAPQDELLMSSVVEVIDHRPQEVDWQWPGRKVTIEVVGSCCSLIASKIFDSASCLLSSQTARLLLGPVLLDTVCLSPSAGRATSVDIQIAKKLTQLIPGISQDEIFSSLHHARSNVQGLSAAQLLRKDLKIVDGQTPMPALQLLLQEYFCLPNALKSIEDLCNSGKYEMAVLMGMKIDETTKEVTRELAIFSKCSETAQKLYHALETNDINLNLSRITLSAELFVDVILCNQGNVKASRKQVLPIVRAFMSHR